MLFNVAD
jgi:hypothetical protein